MRLSLASPAWIPAPVRRLFLFCLDLLDLDFFCFLYGVVWASARVSRISVSEGDAFISNDWLKSDLAQSKVRLTSLCETSSGKMVAVGEMKDAFEQ